MRKAKLLCRRYSLAEGDYKGLALALAIEHEPGFRAIDPQLVELPLAEDDCERVAADEDEQSGFSVQVKNGKLIDKLIDKPPGRPLRWTPKRLLDLLKAVRAEKEKSDLTEDLEALRRLARQKQWKPPAKHRSNSTRGDHDAWINTLQSRLGGAKQLKRKVDALNAELEEIQRRIGK